MAFNNFLHVIQEKATFFDRAEMSDFSGNPFADTDDVNPFAVSH